jgi:YggT family protein
MLSEALYDFFLHPLLSLLVWVIIIGAVLSWLIAFNVVNPRNQFVGMVLRFVSSVTEPLLAPFRRFIPTLGGIDITPILLILSIFFVRDWLLPMVLRPLQAMGI